MTYTRRNRVIQNKNTRKLKSGGGDLTVPNTTTILGYLDDNGIHYTMVDDLQTNDMFSKYYKHNALKKESHLFNKSLLFDVLNNFEKKKDRVQHAFSRFAATDAKYDEIKSKSPLKETDSQYIIQEGKEETGEEVKEGEVKEGEGKKEGKVFVKYLIRNTDIDVINFIKVMHKFSGFLTKYKSKLLNDKNFSKLQNENTQKEIMPKQDFDDKKAELTKQIAACLTVIKEIIADDGKRGAFNLIKEPANEAIKYDKEKDKEEIDETKDSEWSKAEYDILQKYSENSNTIYISLGEIIGEYNFCDECIFFEDEEKGFFDEIKKEYNDELKKEYNKNLKEEIKKSARAAVAKNNIVRKQILIKVFAQEPSEDDIDFAIYNMNSTEFGAFINKSKVKSFANKNKEKFKKTYDFNPYETIKSGVTRALATRADVIANKAAIQNLTLGS